MKCRIIHTTVLRVVACAVVYGLCAPVAPADPALFADQPGLRMNEIQVTGTHNSYHQRPGDTLLAIAMTFVPDAAAWDYSHAPLDVQLERGVRSFELDIHYKADGFHVFHAPLDMGTSCETLVDCLNTVRAWSLANPGHVPISFLLEGKVEAMLLDPAVYPLDSTAFDRLDAEIRSVFPEETLITPDGVRGEYPTLEAAVLRRGWPLLQDVRGKVMFVLHEGGRERDLYTEGRPSLEGRPMFVRSEPGRADAATLVVDQPHVDRIRELARAGYWVRTRADSGIRPAPERLERALASGAHVISTDFPAGEACETTGYVAAFSGNAPARLNPANTPPAE